MHWGRPPRTRNSRRIRPTSCPIFTPGNAVLLLGTLFCLLFFCLAVSDFPAANPYPPEKAAAARTAFGEEHTTLTALLDIDAYFSEPSLPAGAFGESQPRWNFRDYMRDALWHFVFGRTP